MMREEFERIAKREVTDEQYKAIETLYMASNLDKYAFVKSIKGLLQTMPEPEKEHKIVRVSTVDRSGHERTPNGCWIHTIKAELVDIDIATGKTVLKAIPNSYQLDNWCEYHYYDERIQWVS